MKSFSFLLSFSLILSTFSCKTNESTDGSERDASLEIKEEPQEESRQAEALDTEEITVEETNQSEVSGGDEEQGVNSAFILDGLFKYNSEAELIEAFGDDAKRSIGYLPEGMGEYANTILYPETPNQVEFVWKDDSVNFNDLVYVEMYGEGAEWETKEGIRIGTTLKELETLNKQPFLFSGFEWDYAGAVFFEEGALAKRKMDIALTYPDDQFNEKLIGSRDFESDSPLAQGANLTVVMIRLANPEME